MTGPAQISVSGVVEHVGSRVTLTTPSGEKWCLVGAGGLLDGDNISIRGTGLCGLSGARWLIVEPAEELSFLGQRAQLLSLPKTRSEAVQKSKREFQRVSVKLRTCLQSGGPSSPVTVTNLSFIGCQVQGNIPVEVGAELTIDLPPIGLVAARLAWKVSGKGGLTFSPPMDVRRCVFD